MNTLDVIKEILGEISDIENLTFTTYPKQTLIQNDSKISKNDEILINEALRIRSKYSLPFWDSLMLTSFDKNNVSKYLLSRALKHNYNTEKIKTKDIRKIESFLNSNPDKNLSLNSEVNLKNGMIKHFFLLDFHIYPSENNLKIITSVLAALNLHGYILNSGESYHFISKNLYKEKNLIDLLAKSLLFSPIIDRAWIAHQLLERSCSLRVGKKHDKSPTVIKKV